MAAETPASKDRLDITGKVDFPRGRRRKLGGLRGERNRQLRIKGREIWRAIGSFLDYRSCAVCPVTNRIDSSRSSPRSLQNRAAKGQQPPCSLAPGDVHISFGSSRSSAETSYQNSLHDVPRHIGEAEPPSLELEHEPGMVYTQAPQDRGVEIVDVDRVAGDVVTVIIRFPITNPRLHAAARHPAGEASRMVIAAVFLGRQLALTVHGPAEFPTQTTSVSSSSPRCFRSWMSAAAG